MQCGSHFSDDFHCYCCHRPREDVLYDLHLKESFYGSSDAFMTLPVTRWERNLLTTCETTCRGGAFPEAGPVAEEETKKFVHTELSDEDCLLPAPSMLTDLPHCLRQLSRMEPTSHPAAYEQEVNRSHLCHLLNDYLFVTDPWKIRLFLADCHRTSEVPRRDARLWLDYLPMLRTMAVWDYDANASYRATLDPEEEVNRSRRTRRQKGHYYYLESMAPPYVWDGDYDAKDMVLSLAQRNMVWSGANDE